MATTLTEKISMFIKVYLLECLFFMFLTCILNFDDAEKITSELHDPCTLKLAPAQHRNRTQ